MTRDEFRDWFRHFRAAFPSIVTWMGKHPPDRSDNESAESKRLPTQKEIAAGWFKTLEKIEHNDAIAATDELALGDEEEFSYDRSAAAVRKLAIRMSRDRKFLEPKKFDSREPRYDCWRCQDTGFAQIISPKDIQTIAETWPDGPPDKFDHQPLAGQAVRKLHLGTYCCACDCKLGSRDQGLMRFDSERACYFTFHNYQDVRDWFKARATRLAESRKFNEWEPA